MRVRRRSPVRNHDDRSRPTPVARPVGAPSDEWGLGPAPSTRRTPVARPVGAPASRGDAVLTVYSAHGSPGASTTAIYLAAQWASTGTEVLLIEADPGGGSLSHHLGIQFTPGSASFVASGLPVDGANLIDHSQDVLFNNLHIMPATSSPAGARQIVRWWDERAGDLRDIAETEMAVIIDGGRITADSAAAELTDHAAGVVVVARGDNSPTTLEHLGAVLSAEACGPDVERCVMTVGDSPLSAEEWAEKCDITFVGAIAAFAEATGDLSAFLNRKKRKSKKWRVSLEEVAEQLLRYAKPPASGSARSRRSATAGGETAAGAEAESPPPAPPGEAAPAAPVAAPEHGAPPGVHDEAPVAAGYPGDPPQPDPYYGAPSAGYGQAPPPAGDAHHPAASPYAAAPPPPPGYPHYPPEGYGYFEPPPPPPEPVYHEAYGEAPPPFSEPPLPTYQPPPPVAQPPEPPGAYQEPPRAYQEPPGTYQQPPPPQQPYGQPPEPLHDDRSQPPPPQQPPYPSAHQPLYGSPESAPAPPPQPQPPQPVHREPAQPPQPAASAPPSATGARPPGASSPPPLESPPPAPGAGEPPTPEVAASGSFRDWAARLYGQAAQGTSSGGYGGAS